MMNGPYYPWSSSVCDFKPTPQISYLRSPTCVRKINPTNFFAKFQPKFLTIRQHNLLQQFLTCEPLKYYTFPFLQQTHYAKTYCVQVEGLGQKPSTHYRIKYSDIMKMSQRITKV